MYKSDEFYLKDTNDCYSDTSIVTISQPDSIQISFTVIPETDSGFLDGTATANLLGGTLPYTFFWIIIPQ